MFQLYVIPNVVIRGELPLPSSHLIILPMLTIFSQT